MKSLRHTYCLALLISSTCAVPEPSVNTDTDIDVIQLQPLLGEQVALLNNCPTGTIEVEGDYCPVVEQVCVKWIDIVGNERADGTLWFGQPVRCAEYQSPAKCLSKRRIHKHFCIDEYEYPNVKGQQPQSWMSWYGVRDACASEGKRLCTKSEWTFACEGPDMKPFPYSDGYHRDRTACNFDHDNRSWWSIIQRDNKTKRDLDALLVPSGFSEACVSPFGVRDQVGNVDEWVINETGHPFQSALVGGHVFGVRNACRPETTAHGETFNWYETGGRCCISVSDETTN